MASLPVVYDGKVRPEWVDYNNHLGDYAYGIVFSNAADGLYELFGVDPTYREATGCTIYTLELHTTFLMEAHGGDPITVTAQILDADDKRTHLFLRMFRGMAGEQIATQEVLIMHMKRGPGMPPKGHPLPPDALAKLERLEAEHAALPWPDGVGAKIGIRRKQPSS